MAETANGFKMINARQIRKIHILQKCLENSMGWDERQYRTTLFFNFGVSTSKNLTFIQAESLIEVLEEKAIERGVWDSFEGRKKYEDLGQRRGMASPAKLRKIEMLWKEVSIYQDQKERSRALMTFLSRHFHVSHLRFLTDSQASGVICAIENMKKRKATMGVKIAQERFSA